MVIDKRSEFKQRLEQLHEVIFSGLLFYSVWNKLRLHDPKEVKWSMERQTQVLGRWGGFFTPVGIGLQRMAMLEFAKVFDRDSRTVSLVNLLKDAEEDRGLIPHAQLNDLQEIADRLSNAEATLETIKKLRHQRIAHADASPDPLPPLMTQHVESLIEDIKFAFNRLSSLHDNSVYLWDQAVRRSGQETVEVVGLLVEKVEASEKKYDDEMVEIIGGHIQRMETTLGRSLDDEEVESTLNEFAPTLEQRERILGQREPGRASPDSP